MQTEPNKISQIEKLKRQQQIIAAKLQKAESNLKRDEYKKDTRRKILLGSLWLDKIKKEGSFESIKMELDSFLTRNSDRKLFGLPLLENENT